MGRKKERRRFAIATVRAIIVCGQVGFPKQVTTTPGALQRVRGAHSTQRKLQKTLYLFVKQDRLPRVVLETRNTAA